MPPEVSRYAEHSSCDGGFAPARSERERGVWSLLPLALLCTIAGFFLTGCAGTSSAGFSMESFKSFFDINAGRNGRGCRLETLYELLQVDGKTGLTEAEVHNSGVVLCRSHESWGVEKKCTKPLPHVHNGLDMECPFMFNVWDLPKDRLYGRGEANLTRERLVVQCSYEKQHSSKGTVVYEPKWCFSDRCEAAPVNCFTSKEAAVQAQPWAKGAAQPENENEKPAGAKLQDGDNEERDHFSSHISAASQEMLQGAHSKNKSIPGKQSSSLVQTHEAHHHLYRGARRSSLQVTQKSAFIATHE